MSTIYVTAVVPAASRTTAEAAVAPYLVSPNAPGAYIFTAPIVPLGSVAGTTATYYGCCAPCGPETVAAMAGLASAIPGSVYAAVDPSVYSYETNWIGWLAGLGLQPAVSSSP